MTAGARPDGSPYAGLRHYTEADSAFFFGREAERDLVIANLIASRLTLLYGESGVGKSSLLHAGVLPRLRARTLEEADEEPERRLVAVVYAEWSEPDPVARLVAHVAAEVGRVAPGAATPADGDLAAALTALGDAVGGELLVILDQFEESFLYHRGDDGVGSLAFELARALRRQEVPANFLVSIREDQLAQLDRFKGRIPNLFDNLLRVEHLSPDAAREAVVGPLERLNAALAAGEEPYGAEPELVERVLEELVAGRVAIGRRGSGSVRSGHDTTPRIETPYLQLVLARLWAEEGRAGSRTLRAATLDALGGAEAIVRQHLDEALAELSGEEQDAAARLFHYLVTPSGTKIAHHHADLAAYAELPQSEARALLDRLAGEIRILRPVGDDRFEIYHDVLAGAVLDWSSRREAQRAEELRQERRVRRRWRFVALALALAALALAASALGFLETLELDSVDARFGVRGDTDAPDVVAVDIDTKTFDELAAQWPFRRSLHGRVIDRLREAGARVIAYDIQFTDISTQAEDNALVEAVERARGRVVLATSEAVNGATAILGGNDLLREIGARAGNAVLPPEDDGVIRRVPYATDGLESLGIVAAELAGRSTAASELGGDSGWIDFAGAPGTVDTVSFVDVLRGRVSPSVVRDRIAVVGVGAASLQDVHATSTSGREFMTGPEIQANVAQTALDGFPLQSAPWIVRAALFAALALLPALLSLRLAPVWAFAAGLGAAILYLGVAQLAFELGTILPVVYPLGLVVLVSVGALVVDARLGAPARGTHPARSRS